MAKTPTPTIDPVTVEIIRNGLYAVTEEMKTNLMRTAYNLIIYEALDFTVGLFDREGNLLFNARLEPWGETYRAFRLPWSGRPDDAPAGRPTLVLVHGLMKLALVVGQRRQFDLGHAAAMAAHQQAQLLLAH